MAVPANVVQQRPAQPKILGGWKEIAAYLKKSVRSVQRYEREYGLPIRRPQGHARTGVIATIAELDAWVLANPIRDEFKLKAVDPPDSAMAGLRNGMARMARLHEEMQQLRSDVKNALTALRSSILVAGMQKADTSSQYIEGGFGPPRVRGDFFAEKSSDSFSLTRADERRTDSPLRLLKTHGFLK